MRRQGLDTCRRLGRAGLIPSRIPSKKKKVSQGLTQHVGMWMRIWECFTLFCIFMIDPPHASTASIIQQQ
ncbi:uncharacterized protein LOC113650120 isoform X1, partial [Tachysurus ichikawai]